MEIKFAEPDPSCCDLCLDPDCRVCATCGEPECEHHDFVAADFPAGCKCWNDGTWENVASVTPICNNYESFNGEDACANCEHDKSCHKK